MRKKICNIMNFSEDKLFTYFIDNLKDTIFTWDYYVDWNKVVRNIDKIEIKLNIFNALIGKQNFVEEASKLFMKYPEIIEVIPCLLAIRDKSKKILIDKKNFDYKTYIFSDKKLSKKESINFANVMVMSGIAELFKDRKIKNLVDYVIGTEVGLDTNARKNRTGKLMESIVEAFIAKTCQKHNADYIPQASPKKIFNRWGITIEVDKSKRRIDFAICKDNELFFIETNFYNGTGSKLKSTAGEYKFMNKYWNDQGIKFIWITDGLGWENTQLPLREFFDQADYLLNLKMLQDGLLEKIIKS